MFPNAAIWLALPICAICAGLNRARGDDRWMPSWLPGRALWYVTPAIGLVALLVQPWPIALALAAAYWFWALFAWGYLLAALAGFKPERSTSVVEDLCQAFPGKVLPVFARMMFILPGLGLIAWLKDDPTLLLIALAFAAAATAAFGLLFRPMHALDWTRAEIAVGVLWGVVILLV